jgi:large subunit ribosomal protein L6
MSKIGRKPIALGNVQVELHGNEIRYKGKKGSGIYLLPQELKAQLENKHLKVVAVDPHALDINRVWGLNRALLANELKGADSGFERQLRIVGLGFKAAVTGSKIQFSLGFSHKVDVELPQEVTIEIDKTGQLLTLRSRNRNILGLIASKIRALRPPEPYKGTGIQYVGETIKRKAGKAKSAA